jgi:hypothetical protein
MEPDPLSHRANKCWGRDEGERNSPTMPEGDGCMETNVYEVWNLVLAVGYRTNANDPPFDTLQCMHTCTSLHARSGVFLVLISLLVDRRLFSCVCAHWFPFTPSAARQPHIATTITVHCSDSVKANTINFLSRALVFHKARAVVAAWFSNTDTTAPSTKNFSKHLSPQDILRDENIPTKQPTFHPHTSPLIHTQKSHKHHTNITQTSHKHQT